MIRNRVVRQLSDLLDTIQCGIDYICGTQGETAAQVLDSCQWALNQVIETIRNEEIASSQFCLEKLAAVSEVLTFKMQPNQCQIAKQRLESVQKKLLNETSLLEVVFFPYKHSMWDSMESVWRAAEADPMCDTYVVPIPYYDRNPDGSLGTFHYEGTQFPKDIPVVDYESYNMEVRKPDIVYIHNPYDEFNAVTSVDPCYYSYKIKQHTNMLVYIHYSIAGSSKALGNLTTKSMRSAYRHADRIIVQSDSMRNGFVNLGIPKQRVLDLGTPKLDYIIYHQSTEIPSDWAARLNGRTVFLICSSLTDLLANTRKQLLYMQKLLTDITSHRDYAVIWRPHPLMEATLKSMRKENFSFFQKMKTDLLRLDNFIYDTNSDYLPAFSSSHALISDYSSLFMMYGVTGKPVLLLTGSKSDKEKVDYLFIDYYDYYFVEDGFNVEDFIDMVRRGDDPCKEKRMTSLIGSLTNADGTAGAKTHQAIVGALREKSACLEK